MRQVWLAKHRDHFVPQDDEARRLHMRMDQAEAAPFRPIRVRHMPSHRRYWKLMSMCAENCERIEIRPGAWMTVENSYDVHTAIKLCTNFVDWIFDGDGRPVACIPKSTSFEEMTADEWRDYWPRVLDVVRQKVMPGVSRPIVELELLRLCGEAN